MRDTDTFTTAKGPRRDAPDLQRLLAYLADLELEVDRLRRHGRLFHQEVRAALDRLNQLHAAGGAPDAPAGTETRAVLDDLAATLRDLREPPGFHPSHDQVVPIAIRPLAEQVFRWQQRSQGEPEVTLRLELECEHIEWFPARLRHLLDNLLSNALRYRDPAKAEAWVCLGLRATPEAYELRVSDNGLGMALAEQFQVFDLFHRSAPGRAAGLGVGLAVVKLLVEQCGGRLTAGSDVGQGSTFVALLPRYEVDDFLT
jgi:signal transduction histidine kinase